MTSVCESAIVLINRNLVQMEGIMDSKERPYMIQYSSKGTGFSSLFSSISYNITIDLNCNTVTFRRTDEKSKETYETIYPIAADELAELSQIYTTKEFKRFASGMDSFDFLKDKSLFSI